MFDLSILKKLWKARSLWGGIKDLTKEGYSWKLAIKNAATNFAIITAAVAAAAVADYFSMPQNLDLFFGWLPESLRETARSLLAPILATGFLTLRNWAKNRQNEIVWVLPVHPPTDLQKSGDVLADPVLAALPVALSVKPSALIPTSK